MAGWQERFNDEHTAWVKEFGGKTGVQHDNMFAGSFSKGMS